MAVDRRAVEPCGPVAVAPGPNIDADAEIVAFFDEHLRDGPGNGAAAAQVFVRRPARPEPDLPEHPGTWREAGGWPPPGLVPRVLTADRDDIVELDVVGDVGTTAWVSCAAGLPWGQPTDQRIDDARSLTHDWAVTEPLELAGNATVALRVRSSAPVAHVAVKLCDVLPDGTSVLITRGMLNLTHRGCWPVDDSGTSGRRPAPVVPGDWMEVTIGLAATTWTLEPGHSLRLVVAGTDWPNCWPPPGPVRLGLDWSAVALTLPVWCGAPSSTHAFEAGPRPTSRRRRGRVAHRARCPRARDECGDELRRAAHGDHGAVIDADHAGAVGVSTVDPAQAWARGHTTYRIQWPGVDGDGGGRVGGPIRRCLLRRLHRPRGQPATAPRSPTAAGPSASPATSSRPQARHVGASPVGAAGSLRCGDDRAALPRRRARELGVDVGELPIGPPNAITDVPGVHGRPRHVLVRRPGRPHRRDGDPARLARRRRSTGRRRPASRCSTASAS